MPDSRTGIGAILIEYPGFISTILPMIVTTVFPLASTTVTGIWGSDGAGS